MKKIYKVFFILIGFVFLTTFNPKELNPISKNEKLFLKIKNIEIVGNILIEKKEIEKRLVKIYKKNLIFIKRKEVEESLKGIDFLEKIEVKKKYPSTIIVKIFETKPLASLFKDKKKYLLDNSSNLIPFNDNKNYDELPSVFGESAENNFVFFFNQLQNNNFPNEEIKNFYYFQIGRWDLQLFNNKIIKFPANNIVNAIKKSIELLSRSDFENYKIIDLRVNGKIIVE